MRRTWVIQNILQDRCVNLLKGSDSRIDPVVESLIRGVGGTKNWRKQPTLHRPVKFFDGKINLDVLDTSAALLVVAPIPRTQDTDVVIAEMKRFKAAAQTAPEPLSFLLYIESAVCGRPRWTLEFQNEIDVFIDILEDKNTKGRTTHRWINVLCRNGPETCVDLKRKRKKRKRKT